MKYVAGYLMAALGGEASETKVKAILSSVGAEVDDSIVSKLCSELAGKNTEELIAGGMAKLQNMPAGGSGGAASAGGAAAGAAEPEVESEPEEESDDDMGFSLFD